MKTALTPLSNTLLAWFTTTVVAGLLFGNLIFMYMGVIPLSILILGLAIGQPESIEIDRSISNREIWSGDEVEIEIEVTVDKGIGMVTIQDRLPESFEVVDGNNSHVFWKGIAEEKKSFVYKVRCSDRGVYNFPPTHWSSGHPLGFREGLSGEKGGAKKLTVRPKSSRTRDIRGEKQIAYSPFHRQDIAEIGMSTTDFKEIRHYVAGDPLSNINWKATARLAGGSADPLVNEYEAEGRKTVWIFLDANSEMDVGTKFENVFGYATSSADALTRYFTDRRYRVGMYVYNDGERLFRPGGGKKQHGRIQRELLELDTYDRNEGLNGAVQKCKSLLWRYKPLTIVITELYSKSRESLMEGLKMLSAILRGRRRRLPPNPILVIDVLPYDLHPSLSPEYSENAKFLREVTKDPLEKDIREMGASVLKWNPKNRNFLEALVNWGGNL